MATILCQKAYSIHVASACVNWDDMIWTAPAVVTGAPSYVFGPGGYYNIEVDGPGVDTVEGGAGTVIYNGPGCNCRATVSHPRTPGTVAADDGFYVKQDGVLICNGRYGSNPGLPVTDYTIDFAVADTLGLDSLITITGAHEIGPVVKYWVTTGILVLGEFAHFTVQFSNI